MGFPLQLSTRLGLYLFGKKTKRQSKYPFVLMLEPTFRCNLNCMGCGRVREYRDVLDQELSLAECIEAVEECGAPVVSITGGEPLVHSRITEIVKEIMARKKFVHLCTNGLLLDSYLDSFSPTPYLHFVLHLDGMARTHDRFARQDGVFEKAISAIREAKQRGFRVLINTTLYKNTDLEEIRELFVLLRQLGIDGLMTSPAFDYEAVDSDGFLTRKEAREKYNTLLDYSDGIPFYNTPLYVEFLRGRRELICRPWSTPTRNPKGWKSPCYLLTDAHYRSFEELMQKTDWSRYGAGNDPRCAHCMVHSGYEAAAVEECIRNPVSLVKTAIWGLVR